MPVRSDTPYQTPLRWWGSAWRYVAAAGISAAGLISVASCLSTKWILWDASIGVVALFLARFRRRWPVPIAVIALALGIVSGSTFGPVLLIMVSVTTRRRWREITTMLATFALSVTIQYHLVFPPEDQICTTTPEPSLWTQVAWTCGAIGILVGWGLYIGTRRAHIWALRERADRLERERESHTQQARDAERAQIAREMHDVLAHRISQISMQAGAIAFRTDLSADQLREAAGALQESAHAALLDLRGVLGVLRDPDTGAFLDAPQPRFVDIQALIDQAIADGQRVVSDIAVDGTVDETIGRTLYRLTQECLTNVRKHAPGTVLTIRIVGSPDDGVDFTADNPFPVQVTHAPTLPASGLGLIGLTERAELAGGTLTTTRTRHGFMVRCHLPWEHAPAPRPFELTR